MFEKKSSWAPCREREEGTMLKHSRASFLLNKTCPQEKLVTQSLTNLGKWNTELQATLAILSHLRGVKTLSNACAVHSAEVQAYEKSDTYSQDYRRLPSTHLAPTLLKTYL